MGRNCFLLCCLAFYGCNSSDKIQVNDKPSIEERINNQTKPFLEKSIGVWKAQDSLNYALIDSADFYLFKVIYPDYVITDIVTVKQIDGETFIYHPNQTGKEHYKINILDQLVYFDDLGKPFQTYQPLKP